MDAQLSKRGFELGTENQHRAAIALGAGTKNITRGKHSRMGGNGHQQVSEENKEEMRTMLSKDPTLSMRNASLELGILHTTILKFPKEELKLSPYILKMHQQINDEDEFKRIDFASYCRNDLENNSEFLKRSVLLMNAKVNRAEK